MHDIEMPDGSRFVVQVENGVVKLSRTTAWSSEVLAMDTIVGRLVADSLHDCCDHLEDMENH